MTTRRDFLAFTGGTAVAAALSPRLAFAAAENSSTAAGAVVGDPAGAKVGEKVLADGGNAIDAAIAAAFTACIASPSKCGIGGYGGHAMIALAGGKKITAIDFNSTAPAAARPDMYPIGPDGRVVGGVNSIGWLAAGVPGTLAGLELALKRYGTRSLRDVLGPAIALCNQGVHVAAVKGIDDASTNDPRPDSGQTTGQPAAKQRNVALGRLLKTLSDRNSADSFYRGDIAETIAAAFQKNGGLVTRKDLAAFRAREIAPITLEWNGAAMHTVPPTATGLLLLEGFAILKALDWPKLSAAERLHAQVEALRIAWADRLRTFGDPEHVKVPMEELLSARYAQSLADKVSAALKTGQPVPLDVDPSRAGGTVNISAVDRAGNMIALTLTHGGGYGARVSVAELGLVLGHGMSRFDPRPGLPNSPGPGKRPITNMCPTIVTRGTHPVLALGGAGGTRIPNAVYDVLTNYVGLGKNLDGALHAPRIDANGTLTIGLEKKRPAADESFFQKLGYKTTAFTSAYISAVEFDPASRRTQGMAQGGA